MPDAPYRPANGSEGEVFEAVWCSRCACDSDDVPTYGGCPVLANELAGTRTGAWVEREGEALCLLFMEWTADWARTAPADPYAGQEKRAQYQSLPRDPTTGRPVIR